MSVIALLIGLLALPLLMLVWMRKRYSLWKNMGAPYEEPDLFFGNLKGVRSSDHNGELMQKFYRKHKGEGPFLGLYLFVTPVALVMDIEMIKNVLIKDFNTFHDRGMFLNEKDEPVSANMFSLTGSKWKSMRTKMTPTFTSGKMKIMFPNVVEVGKRLEGKLGELSRTGEEFNVKTLMARYTIDTIGTCAFGLECDSLNDESSEFLQVGLSISQNPRNSNALQFLLIAFKDYAAKFGFKTFRDEVSEFYTSIVRKTVNFRIANNVNRNDFIDMLIKMHRSNNEDSLTFNEIVANSFTFLVAGFETSSITLQFCLYCLAENPDIQDKVRDHIKEVLDKHNGELTYEAAMDMKYLEQIINETLRLYSPTTNMLREATADYRVPGTKLTIKKGTMVMIPTFAIHHDPEFYPNPSKFNPDNFSEEAVKSRPSLAFIPFGEGPRICVGARFALMQVKVALIAALLNFRYTVSMKTVRPLKLQSVFILTQVEGGVWLNVEKLD